MTKCTYLGELSLVPYATCSAVYNYFIILTLNTPKPRVTRHSCEISWNRLEWVFGWLWAYVRMLLWSVVYSSSITTAFQKSQRRSHSERLFCLLPFERRLIFFHFNMFGVTKPVGVSFFPQRNSARQWFHCLPTESPKIRPSRTVSLHASRMMFSRRLFTTSHMTCKFSHGKCNYANN